MIYCSHCKGVEGKVILKKYTVNKYGRIYFLCRGCKTEKNRKYRQTVIGRANTNKAAKNNREKSPHKQYARYAVRKALRNGILIKPNNCSLCFKVKKLEAHHEDYSQVLEVEWVCRQCHADLTGVQRGRAQKIDK